MATDSQIPPPRIVNIALPGAMVAMLAVVGYLALDPSLQSSRPRPSDAGLPRPPSPHVLEVGYSRLWEDPLEAAYKVNPETLPSVTVSPEDLAKIGELMEHIAIKSMDDPHGNVPTDKSKFHVMAVLLPGEPHAEASENRRRIRYAVTSALGVAGYHLEFPDRITFASIPIQVTIKAVNEPLCVTLRVPLKLYRTTELQRLSSLPDTSRVLVLWVNESQLGSLPLDAISRLLDRLFSHGDLQETSRRDRLQFTVIGPTSSDTLLAMARESGHDGNDKRQSADDSSQPVDNGVTTSTEAEDDHRWPWSTMTVYSYRATVGGDELEEKEAIRELVGKSPRPIKVSSPPHSPTNSPSRFPRFVRTIGTDRQLVAALFHELRLRQAMPETRADGRHVVILTERDTLYGRSLRELFRFQEANTQTPESGIRKPNLHLFTYLRGIDGQTASESQRQIDESQQARYGTDRLSDREIELPAGASQYDYIRRVAQQVVQLHTRLRRTGEGEISAVGVMGTDVYDKILILQALRPRLPNAVYFTTDLDAALSHVSEYDWTRNLVVASHFGRQLHPSLQREAPVFRDSYQASCFLATLMATGDDVTRELFVDEDSRRDPWRLSPRHAGADESWYLSPLVFEISRTGPYQLSSTGGPWQTEAWYEQLRKKAARASSLAGLVHAPGDRNVRYVSGRVLALGTVSLLLFAICLAASFSPARDLLTGLWDAAKNFRTFQPQTADWILAASLLTTVALLAVIFVDAFRSNGEPFTLVGGVSIWPTVLLRGVATALAGYFTMEAVRSIHDRENRMAADFHLTQSPPEQLRAQPKTRSLWAKIVQFAQAWRDRLPDRIYQENALQNEPVADKWHRLIQRTRTASALTRVAPQVVLFVSFAYLLAPLGDPRSQPARGALAATTEWISFVASLLGIIILTFVVLDLTQCSRYFAKAIRKTDEIHWPRTYVSRQAANRKTPPDLIDYRATIEALALLSKTSSKLIIYPSVVLVVLILAHLSMFDNWTVPWPLLVLLALCIFAAIYGNFSLRNEVRKVRATVLRRLRRHRFAATPTATPKVLHQFDQVIEEIGAERGGAFRPLAEDPLIQAISLPFGGVGGAIILEQLFRSIG